MKRLVTLFLFLLLLSFSFSQSNVENITEAVQMLCILFYTILPIGILLATTLSGVVFALGHISGAETRARANVWATNLMIGAILAGVVVVLAPSLVNILIGGIDLSTTCGASSSSGTVSACDQCVDTYNACSDGCYGSWAGVDLDEFDCETYADSDPYACCDLCIEQEAECLDKCGG